MKDSLIIFGVVALFIAYTLSTRKEGFFDLSGYNKPIKSINEKTKNILTNMYKPVIGITNDDVNIVVKETQKYISEQTGHCVNIIETNKIEKFTGPNKSVLYKARFMVLVRDVGFPYAFGIDIEILNGKVVKGVTQSYDTSNQGVAEEKKGNFEDIEKFYDSKIKEVS